MEKNIIKIIIVLVICIVIISALLIIVNILNKNGEDSNIFADILYEGEPGEEVNYEEVEKVESVVDYYTVRNCINSYLNALNKNSTTYYIGDEYQEKMQIEYVYNILSKEYLTNNSISKEQVLNNVRIYNEKMLFYPLEMKVLRSENANRYIAYGIVQNKKYEFEQELYIIVNIDFKNKTYEVEPINNVVKNIDDIKLENKKESIIKNSYNGYINQKVDNQYVTNEYLSIFKQISLSNPEIIYDLLEENYREKRFGNVNELKAYIDENSSEISKIKLSEYLVNNYQDYREYVAKDSNGNLYIFKETSVGEFTVILDTYTLEYEKFNKEYKNATNKDKVIMNIDKFFQMLNAKDYKTSYNLLDNNFRNNNFRTEDSFKNYMKSKLYSYNDVNYVKFSDEISGVYTYYLEISNKQNKNDEKIKMNIIMQLLEGTNYKLSFEILE